MKRLVRLRAFSLVSIAMVMFGCGGGASTLAGAPPPGGDTVSPSVAIDSPSATGTFTTADDNIVVSGTASDNIGVTSITYTLNGGPAEDATGLDNWSTPVLMLNNGDNTIVITATDAVGNDSTAQIVVTRSMVDPVSPSVAIDSPSATGTFTTASDNVIVSGTASDNVGVASVVYTFNGGPAEVATGLDNWSTPVLLLNNGDNTIVVTATDAAGNDSMAQIVVTRDMTASGVLRAIAIVGDSNSDEFRADDNRGGAFAATTHNWMEQLVLYRGLNFGAWGTRSEPRRSGYEYNWARSGATASSLLSGGQHTGVAQQVAAGDVTLVVVYIGANDFLRSRYQEIYDGTVSGAALANKISGVISDITTAVDTIQAAGPVEILLVNLFDYSLDVGGFFTAFPDPVRRQVVTDAIQTVNTALATMAQQRNIPIVDLTAIANDTVSRIDQNGFINVAGELIDTVNRGDEPHHLILGDSSGHGGTVSNGFTANLLFIESVNNAFGTSLTPFSDQEKLSHAGITP